MNRNPNVKKKVLVTIEKQIEDLLNKLTIEEKVNLCHGTRGLYAGEIKRLGIKGIAMCDGPHGVRASDRKTYLPTGISLASSWNPDLAFEYGAVLGDEASASDFNIVLGPGVNIIRTPLCGRNFEYFSEDPYLSGQIAVGYIRGVQSRDVAACVKHLACNNQEFCRSTISSEVDERTLREIYLPAFYAACKEANVWAVMSAYNKVNGTYSSANRHLQYDICKVEWGWDGLMVSDWYATHEILGAALGGLDLEMPGGTSNFMGEPLLKAVKNGEVEEELINDKIRRLFRLMIRTKAITDHKKPSESTANHHIFARKAACEGTVLLKNTDNFLPLDINKIKTVAVIGPNADKQHSMGGVQASGGSSAVMPPYEITPLAGLKNKLDGQVEVLYAPGFSFDDERMPILSRYLEPERIDSGLEYNKWSNKQYATENDELKDEVHGLNAEYFDNREMQGKPVYECIDQQIMFDWKGEAPNPYLGPENFSIRWTGYLNVEQSGEYELGTITDDGSRLYLDDELIVEQWRIQAVNTEKTKVFLEAGRKYKIKMEYFQADGESSAQLIWKTPEVSNFSEAVEVAEKADVVFVFAGTDHTYDKESNGWGDVPNVDKPDLELIGDQAKLINAIASANPNTAVVLINGSAVSVEAWHENVKAIMECWYPGMEGGNAIADMLLGDAYPSGKLTCTFGKNLGDYPPHANGSYPGTGNHGVVEYSEGIYVGYRYFDKECIEPRYPFGYGLSYTSFSYSNLQVKKCCEDDKFVVVSFDIKNTGDHEGAEIAQVYVKDSHSSLPRPEKELKGFKKVFLKPGQNSTVSIGLDKMAFSYFDDQLNKWVMEPGEFSIQVGSSSREIQLQGIFNFDK